MFGRVTFQKTCQSEAPMVRAASSSAKSMVSRIGISSRTTKGMVTKRVARAIPVPATDDCQISSKGEGRNKKKVKKRTGQKGESMQSIICHTSVNVFMARLKS